MSGERVNMFHKQLVPEFELENNFFAVVEKVLLQTNTHTDNNPA